MPPERSEAKMATSPSGDIVTFPSSPSLLSSTMGVGTEKAWETCARVTVHTSREPARSETK